jgi:vancomycin permeability regulator SanA
MTAPIRRPRRGLRTAGIVGLAAVTATLVAAAVINAHLVDDARPLMWDDATDVPARPVAIVFGTRVEPDGTLSPRLADRVGAAVDLYRAGRVQRLIMTGDRHPPDYDEVAAMRSTAVAAGVPDAAISLDPAGLDTYDSCVRAHAGYEVRAAVLVTQAYHLPRALYLCRQQGIDAVGLAVADWQHHPERSGTNYGRGAQIRHTVREWLARANAPVDTKILRREPAVRSAPKSSTLLSTPR